MLGASFFGGKKSLEGNIQFLKGNVLLHIYKETLAKKIIN
jgi:hypothetical protein